MGNVANNMATDRALPRPYTSPDRVDSVFSKMREAFN